MKKTQCAYNRKKTTKLGNRVITRTTKKRTERTRKILFYTR